MKVVTAYPHSLVGGGSQYYALALAAALAEAHDVHMLVPEAANVTTAVCTHDWQIPFRVMGSSNVAWPDARHYADLRHGELEAYEEALLHGLRRTVGEVRPDFLHCHFLLPSGWAAVQVASEAGIPVIVTSHGVDIRLAERLPAFRQRGLEMLRHKPILVAVSPDHAEWIRAVYHEAEGSCEVHSLAAGVDVTRFWPDWSDDEFVTALGVPSKGFFLCVGRLEERKGYQVALEAARLTGIPLVVVGDGPERDRLDSFARHYKLDHVRLVGFMGLNRLSTIRRLYTQAAALVVPSLDRGETLSFAALEALACETPIIASLIGGPPYVVSSTKAGYTVPPSDAVALARTEIDLVANPDRARALGRLGRRAVQRSFNWHEVATRYISLVARREERNG